MRRRRGPKYKFTEVDSAASQVKSPLPPSVLLLLLPPPQSSPSPLFKPVGIDAHIASGLSDSPAAVRAVGRRRRWRNKRPTTIEEAPPLLAKSVISFTCPCRPLLVVIVAHTPPHLVRTDGGGGFRGRSPCLSLDTNAEGQRCSAQVHSSSSALISDVFPQRD